MVDRLIPNVGGVAEDSRRKDNGNYTTIGNHTTIGKVTYPPART